MADDLDYLSLFSGSDLAAANQAQALAQAIRGRRQAGQLASVFGSMAGDKGLAGFGQQSEAGADRMEQNLIGAAQHRAQQQLMQQHYANEADRWAALANIQQQNANTRSQLVNLKAGERAVTHDMWGNVVTVQKYPDGHVGPVTGGQPAPAPASRQPRSVLPGATGATNPTAMAPAGGASVVGPPAGSGMTQEAFDQTAENAYRTGKFPSYGRATGAMTKALQGRIAQLHPGEDLASVHGAYAADTKSLTNQQKLLDLTQSWEATGKANLSVLREAARNIVNSGSPWVNKPLRAIFEGGLGDPAIQKFKAAHAAVVNEYAKILSGSTGSAGVTDASRREAEGMIPLTATPEQVEAAAQVLETDAGNRLSALQKQVGATKERMGSKPQQGGAPTGAKARIPVTRNGVTRYWNGTGWED